MLLKSLIVSLLLISASLLSGCYPDVSTSILPNPCDTDSSLAGCSGGTSTGGTGTLNTGNAVTVLSSSLHDILAITQVMLASVAKSHDYQNEIQSVINYQSPRPYSPGSDDPDNPGPVPEDYSEPCDNGGSYTISILAYAEGYDLGGTTASINFGGHTTEDTYDYAGDGHLIYGLTDPEIYCRIGSMNISGVMNITRISFAPADPGLPDNWAMNAEIWPTLTIHHDPTPDNIIAATDTIADLTSITNPIRINAAYTQDIGLTVTGTVMHNPYANDNPMPDGNIDGVVFSHFKAGTSPNDPDAVSNNSSILRTDSTVIAGIDSTDPQLDPVNATRLSITVDGGIVSDRTGAPGGIDMMVQTVDTSDTSEPLTWQGNSNVVDAPERTAPTTGALTITDLGTLNRIAATTTSVQGDIDLLITDNTAVPPTDTNQSTKWYVLMWLH